SEAFSDRPARNAIACRLHTLASHLARYSSVAMKALPRYRSGVALFIAIALFVKLPPATAWETSVTGPIDEGVVEPNQNAEGPSAEVRIASPSTLARRTVAYPYESGAR